MPLDLAKNVSILPVSSENRIGAPDFSQGDVLFLSFIALCSYLYYPFPSTFFGLNLLFFKKLFGTDFSLSSSKIFI